MNSIRIIPKEQITEKHYMKTSIKRAKTLKTSVSIDYFTEKNYAFIVSDPETGSTHSVIFLGNKKPPEDWSCDCKWYAQHGLKGIYCAHILAVNLCLQEDSLEKTKKEENTQ